MHSLPIPDSPISPWLTPSGHPANHIPGYSHYNWYSFRGKVKPIARSGRELMCSVCALPMFHLQTPLTLHSQNSTVASTQRGTTVNENGIMQNIRDLFSNGFNAAEIIAQGYAPSTVYRVQRDTRRKSGRNGNSAYRKGSTNYGLEQLGHLETDNQRIHQRLDSLESQLSAISEEADASPLWDRLEELQSSLEKIATRQEQITRQLQAHNAIIGRIDAELDALARVFKDETWLGNPKWQRQTATK
jgi:hypothetical protein